MTITNISLVLLAVLALVLLTAVIVSYREFKGRQQSANPQPTSDAFALLKAHLDLCTGVAEAQQEMLRTFCDVEARRE